MNFEALRYRLEIIERSVERSRAAFITSTIAALALMIGAWNAYLSAYRGFPLWMRSFSSTEVTKAAQKELLKQWVESTWVSFTPLGIRIGIGDAAVIGGLGLYVISVWLFFAARRENRTIAHLFYDVQRNDNPDIHRLVHHGVTSAMLFLSVADDDLPMSTVESVEDNRGGRSVLLRKSVNVLLYLPAIAIFFILALDVASLFVLKAAFRESHQPLLLGRELDLGERTQFGVMTFVEIVVALATTYVCQRIIAFERATTDLIRQHEKDHYPRAPRERR